MAGEEPSANQQEPRAALMGLAPLFPFHPTPYRRSGASSSAYIFAPYLLSPFLLVATWPVSDTKDTSGYPNFSLLGFPPLSTPADQRQFLTVIAAGALGSLIHTVTSFADYVGNRTLSRTWIWWLVLRTPIGIALALLFYLVLRSGLIVPSLPNAPAATDTTHLLNPYGIAAISAMAGMFSKQATDKLREIFDTLFRTNEPVARADPMTVADSGGGFMRPMPEKTTTAEKAATPEQPGMPEKTTTPTKTGFMRNDG